MQVPCKLYWTRWHKYKTESSGTYQCAQYESLRWWVLYKLNKMAQEDYCNIVPCQQMYTKIESSHLNELRDRTMLCKKSKGLLWLGGNEVHVSCSFWIIRLLCPLSLSLNDFLHISFSITAGIIYIPSTCCSCQCLCLLKHSKIWVHLHGLLDLAFLNIGVGCLFELSL